MPWDLAFSHLLPGLFKVHSHQEAVQDLSKFVPPTTPTFVDYFAASCPHCQHLEPIWAKAHDQWLNEHRSTPVAWVQKECYGKGWVHGHDYDECHAAGVEGFPTLKFFDGTPDSKGEVYDGDRTPAALVNFLKDQLPQQEEHVVASPNDSHGTAATGAPQQEERMVASSTDPHGPAATVKPEQEEHTVASPIDSHGPAATVKPQEHEHPVASTTDSSGTAATATESSALVPPVNVAVGAPRIVGYFATGCHYCRQMMPQWMHAKESYNFYVDPSPSNIQWEAKECYDQDWHHGRDYDECKSAGVQSFPTIKYIPGADGGTEKLYTGSRDFQGLLNFAEEQSLPVESDDPNINEASGHLGSSSDHGSGAAPQTDLGDDHLIATKKEAMPQQADSAPAGGSVVAGKASATPPHTASIEQPLYVPQEASMPHPFSASLLLQSGAACATAHASMSQRKIRFKLFL